MKKLNSSFRRRIATVVLLAGITGTFLSMYYFVYLPRQRGQFNAQTFRTLNNIALNFTDRLLNYGDVSKNAEISRRYKDIAINSKYLDSLKNDILATKSHEINPDSAFIKSFTGFKKVGFSVSTEVLNDKAVFRITGDSGAMKMDRDSGKFKLLKDFLDPLIISHNKIFDAIYLIRQGIDSEVDGKTKINHDQILYRPERSELSIANINTDSLFPDMNLQVPHIVSIRIDDIPYKMFMLPFRIPTVNEGTYILAALMEEGYYNDHVQNIPLSMLATVLVLIIAVMLTLPFLKIYLLNANESLKISDIRSLIAVVFILPFLVVLICSVIWIYNDQDNFTDQELKSLNKRISNSFYKEIATSLEQQEIYDSMMVSPTNNKFKKFNLGDTVLKIADLKDEFLHPEKYLNFTNMHWMDSSGKDMAVWNLTNADASYFDVSTRPYFLDIRYGRRKFLPEIGDKRDTVGFSIQPILSRLTGEYTISIATGSNAIINGKRALAKGISSRMYSVYNAILPSGYGFCIIDSSGLVLCSSDTSRNLQENIFRESTNNYSLRNAVSHKDDVILRDIELHDQTVKMKLRPMPGLPYYLITYHQQRRQTLFIFHVAGFTFISQVLLLLLSSFFSYLIMLSKKRIGKLSFEPSKLNWLKPSPAKRNYYAKNAIQLVICFLLISIISVFYSGNNFCLYWLNVSILLPLFVVTGYYMIRNAKSFADKKEISEDLFKTGFFSDYIRSSSNILILYILFIVLYLLVRNGLFFQESDANSSDVTAGILILSILMPLHAALVAGTSFNFRLKRAYLRYLIKLNLVPGYLGCFILSLLMAVFLISIVPVFAFVNFGFREEKKLQLQSAQVELAKKIQQRRSKINPVGWQTKLDTLNQKDKDFIRSMKFCEDKGVYLNSTDTLYTIPVYNPEESSMISCSPYYQVITQALFLPPDHDDFYSKSAHKEYYFWKSAFRGNPATDSLILSFRNTTDFRDNSSFNIRTTPISFYQFSDYVRSGKGFLLIFSCLLFLLCFYKVIYSTTKRIFLLNYFKPGSNFFRNNSQDTEWLKSQYSRIPLEKVKNLMHLKDDNDFSFEELRKKEREYIARENKEEEFIIQIHLALLPVYERIWRTLTDAEKFTLYDFAADGFTNYKKMLVLSELFNKGLLVSEEEKSGVKSGDISFMSLSFRNFLLTKEDTAEIKKLTVENKMSSWGTLRLVFVMVLIAFAIFLLITQQEATQRIVTIVTSLGTLLPLMLKLFDSSSSGTATKKS